MENGTYEQIVTHLGRQFEPNSLEAPDDLQLNLANMPETPTPKDPSQRATTVKTKTLQKLEPFTKKAKRTA